MAHLTGFGLENFRVFKEYTWFDFAPITILVGPNNSGKSSLIKALLLIKYNVEKGLLPAKYNHVNTFENEHDYIEYYEVIPLKFINSVHGLNSPLGAKSRQSIKDELTFLISYTLQRPFAIFTFEPNDKQAFYRLSFVTKEEDIAEPLHRVEILNQYGVTILKILDKSIYFNPIEYDKLVYEDDQKISTRINLPPRQNNTINHSQWIANLEIWFLANQVEEKLAKLFSDEIINYLGLSGLNLRARDNDIALDIIEQIGYWAPSRNEQKRVYSDDDKSNVKLLLDDYREAQSKLHNDYFMSRYAKLFELPGIVQSIYESERGTYFPNRVVATG